MSFLFFLFYFHKKSCFIVTEKDKPSEKIVIVEEELDGIDTDEIGNLEDILRAHTSVHQWEM